ncbi:MAG TPA: transketolase [Burkholderiales bacterium]|nr:transketolase [Burkholderiales bacterium]
MTSRLELANAIRVLAMDAVQQANSGHPGMPMGMADIAEVLWTRYLRHNPANPKWPDRDRFVVSNGHGSMLLYALLHLTGYDLPMTELKNFRQLHSKTPGHPEYEITVGVETTTGPLGQGLANAVGMAIAERVLAADFNIGEFKPVDHYTYVFLGDGCLMEGVSHEACSLAGTLGLSKLIGFWDDNGISIDSEKGSMPQWFTDDTPKRFEAYGWHVIRDVDGHDSAAVEAAIEKARSERSRPTLICCKTIIAKGAPKKANTGAAHGAPLGAEEVAATRKSLGWNHPAFEIPREIYAGWDARERGAKLESEWNQAFEKYAKQHRDKAAEFRRRMSGELPTEWRAQVQSVLQKIDAKAETIATRKASQNMLEALGPVLPELIGGSADLAASNLAMWSGSRPVGRERGGNYIYFGVREFAMAAISNGIALHGGLIPYCATFLTFSDYARNALRMAALMKQRVIYVFTHDSIGLGEDGPTHQPIEHAASLRLIPNMDVWRPCDATESAVAWFEAVGRRDGPASLLFTRQNVPAQSRTAEQLAAISRGGYVLSDAASARAVLIASGSEVQLAIEAQKMLASQSIPVRVVSMPSTNVFDRQSASYRADVLPRGIPRIAVEAGVTDCWRKYVGLEGAVIGIDRFGESAPAADVFKHFGFTAENVVNTVKTVL